MFTGKSINCITGQAETLSCYYDSYTQSLTVYNVSTSDLPAGTNITVTADGFVNPYNALPKSGFIIQTIDPFQGDIIEKTGNLSVQVTKPATFYAKMARNDTVTTVSELSSIAFSFYTSLPTDARCLLRITFPDDMLPTSSIKFAGVAGQSFLFNQTSSRV